MIDFFLNNYQWFFSGLGIFILSSIISVIIYLNNKQDKTKRINNAKIPVKNKINIIEVLKKNYTWIFSGVGVFFVAYMVNLIFFRKDSLEKSNVKNVQLENSNNNIIQQIDNLNIINLKDSLENIKVTEIDPLTIYTEIFYAPLIHENTIGSSYIGINVKWHLFIKGIEKEKNKYRVSCSYDKDLTQVVFFYIDIEKYPFLKPAKYWKEIQVFGKIIKCELPAIELQIFDIKEISEIENIVKNNTLKKNKTNKKNSILDNSNSIVKNNSTSFNITPSKILNEISSLDSLSRNKKAQTYCHHFVKWKLIVHIVGKYKEDSLAVYCTHNDNTIEETWISFHIALKDYPFMENAVRFTKIEVMAEITYCKPAKKGLLISLVIINIEEI